MRNIKRYVRLHHQLLNKSDYAALFISAVIPLEFLMGLLIMKNNSIDKEIMIINSAFYISAALGVFFCSGAFNSLNIKACLFFRASRKNYYISLMFYICILAISFSIIHILVITAAVIVLNNTNTLAGISIQFEMTALVILFLTLLFNVVITLTEFYDTSFIVLFIILAVSFYPLKIYSNVSYFVGRGGPLPLAAFLLLSILFMYIGWLLIKNTDIKKVDAASTELKKKEDMPFERNYFKYLRSEIPKYVIFYVIFLFIAFIFKIITADAEGLIWFTVGMISCDSAFYVFKLFKNRNLHTKKV